MCSLKKNEINWINSGKRRWLRPLWLWKFLDSLTNGLLMQQILWKFPWSLSMQNSCPETHLSLGFDAIFIMQRTENSLFHPNLKENNRKWHTIWLKNCMHVFSKYYLLCLNIFHIHFIHNKSHHCTAFRIITIQNCTCSVFTYNILQIW